MFQERSGFELTNLGKSIGSDECQVSPSTKSPLDNISMAAQDVRGALGAAQTLMVRLVGYPPQDAVANKTEPSEEPPLLDLLGKVGLSISAQARDILACINAINAKLP